MSGKPEKFEYAVAAGAQPRKIPGLEFEYAAFTRRTASFSPASTLGRRPRPFSSSFGWAARLCALPSALPAMRLLRRRVRFAYKAEGGVYTGSCVARPCAGVFSAPDHLPAGFPARGE